MKTLRHTVLAAACFATTTVMFAADSSKPPPQAMPPMPEPTKEHKWLQQFVGEWESEAEVTMAPDQPATKSKGTDRVRNLGDFWIISEGTGEMPGMEKPMTWLMTLGYDPEKRKYVGTWVDSMNGYLWTYEGTVDASGKKLVLESEGPCPTRPGMTRFRDITEFKGRNERVFTSAMQNDDGSWTTMVKGTFRRTK